MLAFFFFFLFGCSRRAVNVSGTEASQVRANSQLAGPAGPVARHVLRWGNPGVVPLLWEHHKRLQSLKYCGSGGPEGPGSLAGLLALNEGTPPLLWVGLFSLPGANTLDQVVIFPSRAKQHSELPVNWLFTNQFSCHV